MKRNPLVSTGLFIATLVSGVSLAQEVPRGGESYGPGANYLVIPSAAFMPDTEAMTYSVDSHGYIFTSLGATFRAPVDLPAGASVVNVCAFTYDNDGAFNVGVQWEAREMGDSDANAKEAQLGITSTSASGTPGFALTCVPLASPTHPEISGSGRRRSRPLHLVPCLGRYGRGPDGFWRRRDHVAAYSQPGSRIGDLRRRADELSLFPRDRGVGRLGDHGWLRQRKLLPEPVRDTWRDGGVPGTGPRVALAVLSRSPRDAPDSDVACEARSLPLSCSPVTISLDLSEKFDPRVAVCLVGEQI